MSKIAFLALSAAVVASPALAQSDAEPGSWSFAFGGASDNRSKNASKSDGNPFIYGLAEWESADGLFYAGPAFETIKSSTGSDLEVQVGAGYRPEVAGFDLDLGVVQKWQINADPGTDNDSFELTANASRSIGRASARLQVQYSPNSTGSTEAFTWVEARLGWDLTDTLEATAAVGRREQDNSIDYNGWNVGVIWAFNPRADIDLRWYDTDADLPGEQYEGGLVAGINLYF